jgi:membrane protein implicated in regulation of membrane protease activity
MVAGTALAGPVCQYGGVLPVLWLIAGVVLIAAEVLSGDFVLVMLGAAALGAAGASALGLPAVADAAVFAVLSAGLIVLARPALKRRVHRTPELRTNAQALVGSRAVVESTVDAHGGRVRIQGAVWSARAFDETQVLQPGQTVTVMEISGATAVVWAEP